MKPWQKREWCIPPEANAEFVCKMEDILDVYKQPYSEKRPVICMDERNKQCIKETRIPIAASPGQCERYDTEYERNGVCNIFLHFEPLKRRIKITDHRKKQDWAFFIKELVDEDYPDAEKIILVMDNLNTHAGTVNWQFTTVDARIKLKKLYPVLNSAGQNQ